MTILEQLSLSKGHAALSVGQFQRRILAYNDNIWPAALREQYTDAFELWKDQMRPILADAEVAFAFNHALSAYRGAVERLGRYIVSEGQTELTEEQPTGAFDENGDPITETVVVRQAIEPAPATVEVETWDEETETMVTTTIPNPLIETDVAERARAQGVIDRTPADVVAFYSTSVT